MTKSTRIASRLNKALAMFISVPLVALPAAAQERTTSVRVGVRANSSSGAVSMPKDKPRTAGKRETQHDR